MILGQIHVLCEPIFHSRSKPLTYGNMSVSYPGTYTFLVLLYLTLKKIATLHMMYVASICRSISVLAHKLDDVKT